MSTETIHPMVMKAARAMAAVEAEFYGPITWDMYQHANIRLAQTALTECGALAVLEALEASERVQTNADADAAHMLAHQAIAKVYGSAP